MDPRLHALIPLVGSVTLAFAASCGKGSEDENSGGDAFKDHCQAMLDCSPEYASYLGTAEECAAEMRAGYLSSGGQACVDAQEEYYECYNGIAVCLDGSLEYDEGPCDSLLDAAYAACGGDDDDYDDTGDYDY